MFEKKRFLRILSLMLIVHVSGLKPFKYNDGDNSGEYTYFDVILDKIHEPESIRPLSWVNSSGKEVKIENAYRVALPSQLRLGILSFTYKIGLLEYVSRLLPSDPFPPGTEEYISINPRELWHVRRPGEKWGSDMHFISPGDKNSHNGMLKALRNAEIDKVLDSIGRSLGLTGILCYHLSFIAVSTAAEGMVYQDVSNTGGKVFNLYIPLVLEELSSPEENILVEYNKESVTNFGRLKYEYNVGVLMGDDVMHVTSATNGKSKSGVRLMASIFIADINESNVDKLEFSQPYPPKDRKSLLSKAGEHWKLDNSSNSDVNIIENEDMNKEVEFNSSSQQKVHRERLISQFNDIRSQNDQFMKELKEFENLNKQVTREIKEVMEASKDLSR